ncbi:MAG: SpoIIIAH-like family protein [Bacilli bacterium]|nr:SpoIIIAH-like family protein [Bacilli bacterium]
MIKKQSLWFLTLFSLVLVLGVYYITMPTQILENNKDNDKDKTTEVNLELSNNNTYLTALEVSLEEERTIMKKELQDKLSGDKTTTKEKNDAYLSLRKISEVEQKEDELKNKIKETYKLDSFVKIDNNDVDIVIIKKEHDISLANKIMKTISGEFEDKVSVSIKFA